MLQLELNPPKYLRGSCEQFKLNYGRYHFLATVQDSDERHTQTFHNEEDNWLFVKVDNETQVQSFFSPLFFLFFDPTYITPYGDTQTHTLSVSLPYVVLLKLLGFKLCVIGGKPSPPRAASSGPG